MVEGCLFCNIACGNASVSVVYEDESVLAFMDLNPISMGHTLVVSREHWENLYDVPEETLSAIIRAVKQVSFAVKKTVGADGIRIIQNNGRSAGQVVMHIHFHVVPTFSEKRTEKRRNGRVLQKRNELDETAQKIRVNL